MQRETRPRSSSPNPPARAAGPASLASVPEAVKNAGRSAEQPDSLTAKMLEYRSWWNLPRERSRKAHS